ncbi:MAG: pbpE 2 [Phycisphaerales bacterium]|nr:pbpE 2 [Phycisphaerales bacterium]
MPSVDDPQTLPRTAAVLAEWTASGHHIGALVYVSRDLAPVADFAVGDARLPVADHPAAVPMAPDTLMLWLSAGKPFAAVALAQLRERGLLDFDDAVARFVPEFAAAGKGHLTLAHLLTHTAGLRFVETGWPDAPWDQIIATVCAAAPEPDWPAGEKAGYSPFASWFVLAEVVRRLDGRAYGDYVRDEVFLPLGMTDSWIAMPPARYRAYGDRIGVMANTQKKPPEPAGLDTEAAATHARPSGGARGPARELGRFYECMLEDGAVPTAGGGRILSAESVALLVSPRRVGLFDHTFRTTMDWGLGFIVNSARYGADTVPYGYGRQAGERAFGHGGAQSTCAFADPDRRLAVAITFNGQPGEPAHHRRLRATLAALEADLGTPHDAG